jgi:probable phosphoglycerate mutase
MGGSNGGSGGGGWATSLDTPASKLIMKPTAGDRQPRQERIPRRLDWTTNSHSMPDTKSPTRVLLLRHAETAEPDLFHGAESDVGLGARGLEQARRVAERLVERQPDAVYSSGMRRAVETAGFIAGACGLALGQCDGLHERRMGRLSGLPRGEGWPHYEEAKEHWKLGRVDFTHEGGESFSAMSMRAVAAFRRLLDREAGRTVVVVAHGVINRVLIASMVSGYSFADFDRISIDFVGVHHLVWDGATLRLMESLPGEPTPPLRPPLPRS